MLKRTKSRSAAGESKTTGPFAGEPSFRIGRSVQSQGTLMIPPMRKRTNTHGLRLRQKTRFTRPDWPQ